VRTGKEVEPIKIEQWRWPHSMWIRHY